MKVEITARAAADLEEIADWISEDNPERADSFVAELIEKGMSLSHNAAALSQGWALEGRDRAKAQLARLRHPVLHPH